MAVNGDTCSAWERLQWRGALDPGSVVTSERMHSCAGGPLQWYVWCVASVADDDERCT